MSGLDEKAVLAACEAYHADIPTHDPPSRWAMEQAISAYLAAAAPADVGEEPVAYQQREQRIGKDDWSHWYKSDRFAFDEANGGVITRDKFRYEVRALYPATALEQVTRERDEARAVHRWSVDRNGDGTLSVCRGNHDKADECEWEHFVPISRATSAEAKLAEARKVIEPFAEASREFNFAIGPDGIDDGITVIASTVVRDREATLSTSDFSAARRFLEETK